MGGAFFDPTYNNSKDGYISQLPLGKKSNVQQFKVQTKLYKFTVVAIILRLKLV